MPREIKERRPDLLLTGHGGAVDCDATQVDRWTEIFTEIIDHPHPNLGMDLRYIEFYPYKVRIRPGKRLTLNCAC